MGPRDIPIGHWRAVLVALAVILCGGTGRADSVAENSVKAGFVYNFAKFVTWPAGTAQPEGSALRVCTLGPALSGKIALLDGRRAQSRSIQVRSATSPSEWLSCDILYLGLDDASRADEILTAVASAPVLTVSDLPAFVRSGGIIGLKVVDNRVAFDVNLAAARRSGLSISSQILNLAREVVQ
jgi:hypothetical protein